jgi:hypothetical protein
MAYKFQLGDAIMSGSLRQEEDFRVDGTLDANSSADIAGAVNMQSTLAVAGASTLEAASFSGAIDANSSANIQGAVVLQSTLNAQGAVDCDSTLNVDGASTMAAVTADGAIDFSSTLNVDGASTLAAITMDGALINSSTSNLQGAVDCDSTLNVDGASTLAAASFSGAIDANSTADFQGDVNLQAALAVAGATVLASAKVSDLTQGRLITVGSAGELEDQAALGYTDDRSENDGYLSLYVSSSASGSSYLADGAMSVYAADGSDIFSVSADGAAFAGSVEMADALDVAGASTLAAASFSGAIDANSTSDFQGAMNLQAGITIAGASDLNSTLDVSGDTKLAASGVGTQVRGDLTVDEAASFSSTIGVSGASTLAAASFSGAIDANSTMDVSGDTKLAASGVGTQVRGDLTVDEAAAFNGNVTFGNASGDGVTWNAGSLNQTANALTWQIKDGVDGFSGNGALLMFTGSGGDFLKINTSGSQKGVVFPRTFYPSSDDAIDIGASDKKFKDIYIDGTAYLDAIDGTTADFSSTLNVDGISTMAAITADGAIDLSNASVQFSADLDSAFDIAADAMYYRDASDGALKSRSWATIIGQIAGAGLTATNGQLSSDGAVAPSAWSNGGTLVEGLNYAADLGSGVAQSMTLPASPDAGDQVSVKAAALPGGATMTISAAGSQDIDGASALVLESPYAAVSLVYVGSDKWRIV